jgi:hypothetical protein
MFLSCTVYDLLKLYTIFYMTLQDKIERVSVSLIIWALFLI